MLSRRWMFVLLSVIAVCTGAAGFWLARELDSSKVELTSGTWLPQARSVGDFALQDQTGAPFTQAQLQGAPALVFFGFTHCPDVCPTTLFELAQVKRAAVVPHLRVLFVSVDPARDTPALLAQYLRAFDPRFIGLTGPLPAIERLTRLFGVAFARVELPGGDYTMDHSAALFLLDAHGRIVAIFTPPFDVKRLEADLHRAAGAL